MDLRRVVNIVEKEGGGMAEGRPFIFQTSLQIRTNKTQCLPCKGLAGPIIPLSFSGLVWKKGFAYGFDHFDAVNNHFIVQEATLAW